MYVHARFILLNLVLLFGVTAVSAQHQHHAPSDTTHAMPTSEPMMPAGHHDEDAHPMGHASMSSALTPGTPMSRDGSGTAWLPDAAPTESLHGQVGGWGLMLHGAAFVRYTAQDVFGDGTRGSATFDAPNWMMGMAQRGTGRGGLVTVRAMLSLDPLTEGGGGYPLLFQSGETYQGARLVDRQHPHDLFSELSLTFSQRLGPSTAAFAYLAYPGEPAIGPVAFMHRPSARFNPDSPLGHHWQDATHIAFGVATLGFVSGPFKIDGSLFTGTEPDEDRYGFDAPTFDSYAARVTYNPSPRVSLQASRAFLREPEALEPGVDQWRTTASALYSAPLTLGGDVSAALVWGMNDLRPDHEDEEHHGGIQHALLGEATLHMMPFAVYGRAEYTQKSPEELALEEGAFGDEAFDLFSVTLGAGYELLSTGGLSATLGGQASYYVLPESLQPLYGDAPVSAQVYLRLAPSGSWRTRR